MEMRPHRGIRREIGELMLVLHSLVVGIALTAPVNSNKSPYLYLLNNTAVRKQRRQLQERKLRVLQ